jgi:6-pyruvoyltetrahydropterin/6-carboxytetrahydropterin synthase
MFTVSREFSFSYGHRLLNHGGKCAHPHGHNARVRIVLKSDQLNEDGMVLDFSKLKQTIGQWLEDELDHRMILEENDPLVEVLRKMNEPMFLLKWKPTAENLARLLFEKTVEFGFPAESVVFWETEKCSAEYRCD